MNALSRRIWMLITATLYRPGFRHIGTHSIIYKPMQLDSCGSVSVGSNVLIARGAWLMGDGGREKTIDIGDNTTVGHFFHIIGLNSVTVGKNVLIADKVFITDCTHSYQDPDRSVQDQPVTLLSPVVIGDDSWIGENVCILGASVGRHCVIGANAVVTEDIPDYSVAAGCPARVIKRYDQDSGKWVSV